MLPCSVRHRDSDSNAVIKMKLLSESSLLRALSHSSCQECEVPVSIATLEENRKGHTSTLDTVSSGGHYRTYRCVEGGERVNEHSQGMWEEETEGSHLPYKNAETQLKKSKTCDIPYGLYYFAFGAFVLLQMI
eukprot:g55062.t1